VVIFDEASQVTPAVAITSIVRGSRLSLATIVSYPRRTSSDA
jgi:hypothetical protein